MLLLFIIKLEFLKFSFPYIILLPSKSVITPPAFCKIACPAAMSHSKALGSVI